MSTAASGREPRDRLLESTTVVGSMTVLSRIAGLARDVGFSRWFGAGPLMDAFFVAFKIPNLLRRFFAEGAFSQAFVPVMAEYRSTRPAADTRELIDSVSGTLALVLFVATVIGVVAAPVLIAVFAPGFVGVNGRHALASDMLRLTFPYLLFISLTALAGAILNTWRRFAVPAVTPLLLNLVLIAFAAWVAPRMERPGLGLAAGVFVAGIVQLAFQAPFLLKLGLLPRPRWGWRHPGVRRVLRLMMPAIFGSSVAQINIMLDTLVASFLAAGSISWLYYSDRLMEFPLGVIGIAIATVILPHLAEHHARASGAAFVDTLDWALRWVLVIALPAALGLMLLAEPLLATIFYGGEFTTDDVRMSSASLRAFAPGLIGFILVKVLASAYFARQDTRTPVRVGVVALVLNIVLNVIFVLILTHTRWAPAHAGLALATSLAGLLNAGLLLAGLLVQGIYRTRARWRPLLLQAGGGCVALTVFELWVLGTDIDWTGAPLPARIAWLFVGVAGGVAVYAGVCRVLGLTFSDLKGRHAPHEVPRP